jgi:hypothetical protein
LAQGLPLPRGEASQAAAIMSSQTGGHPGPGRAEQAATGPPANGRAVTVRRTWRPGGGPLPSRAGRRHSEWRGGYALPTLTNYRS